MSSWSPLSRVLLTGVLLAGVGGLVGCAASDGGDTADAGTAGAVTADQLAGRTFLSTQVSGPDAVPLVDGSRVVLEFEDGRLSGTGGCNRLGGSYEVDGDALVLAGPLITTEMACDPPLMEQDAWVAALLEARPTLTLEGDTLTLATEGVTLAMLDRTVADPDRPLVGTTWALDGLISTDVASSVPAGVTASLQVVEEGRAYRALIDTGCNSASAAVTFDDDTQPTTMTLGPVASTLKACPGAAAEVERDVLAVLDGEVAVSIEADALTLTKGDRALTYRAEGR
jgi:heat shock protein HslJ